MKKLCSAVMICTSCVAFSETYYFVGASGSSWQDVNNYRLESMTSATIPGSLPGADDIVDIRGSAGLTNRIEVLEADNDFVANLKGIAMWYGELTLTINTNTAFNCAFSGARNPLTEYSRSVGCLVKKGTGTLSLHSRSHFNTSDYLIREIRVEAGEVDFLPNAGSGSAGYIGTLNVLEGAKVKLPAGGATECSCDGFNGAGEISYAGATQNYTVTLAGSAPHENVFSGKLIALNGTETDGMSKTLRILLAGPQAFMGPAVNYNYYTLVLSADGYTREGTALGFENSAARGATPFANMALTISSKEGKPAPVLKKIGNGTVSYYPQTWISSGEAVKLDAGDEGGMNITSGSGYWVHECGSAGNVNKDGVGRMILAGDGPTPSLFDVSLYSRTINGVDEGTSPLAIVKQGRGTWKITETSYRDYSGVVAVDEGTLRYTTIKPVGTPCALGRGSMPYDPDYSHNGRPYDTSKAVGYHLRVGGGTTEGTLEYVGTAAVDNKDRIVAVNGFGRVRNASDKTFEKWGFVTAKGGEHTLALDGVDVAGDITNTVGTLSVVKEGSNTMELKGQQTFNGDLSVKDGRLLISNPHPTYEYYRFTIKKNMASTPDPKYEHNDHKLVRIREFALYDADGNNLTANKIEYQPVSVGVLQPGQVCYEQGSRHTSYGGGGELDNLFDDSSKTFWDGESPQTNMSENELGSWIKFVIRMPAGSPPVASFDFVGAAKTNGVYYIGAPRVFTLEASVNGVDWEPFYAEDDAHAHYASNFEDQYWLSDHQVFVAGATRTGFASLSELPELPPTVATLANVRSMSVDSGATLELVGVVAPIKGLRIDAQTGMGTVTGATLASNGVVDLIGFPADAKRLQVPVDWSGFSNLEALSGWTFLIDGEPAPTMSFSRNGTGLLVTSTSFLMILR